MLPAELYAEVRKLEIETKKVLNSYFSGEYLSAFKGRGVEFEEVRPYVPGDEVRAIDWNVSARMNNLFIKIFREERELSVLLLVDLSASMFFGSGKETKRELLLKAAALLGLAAMKNNDRVGLILFDEKVRKVLMPRKGRKHVLAMFREMLSFLPGKQKTDLKPALEFINQAVKKKSVIFIFSDFKTEGYRKLLEVSAKKHDVIPVLINDPAEKDLKIPWFMRVEDLETGEQKIIRTKESGFGKKYRQDYLDEYKELKHYLRSISLEPLELETGQAYLPTMLKYFKRRKR